MSGAYVLISLVSVFASASLLLVSACSHVFDIPRCIQNCMQVSTENLTSLVKSIESNDVNAHNKRVIQSRNNLFNGFSDGYGPQT